MRGKVLTVSFSYSILQIEEPKPQSLKSWEPVLINGAASSELEYSSQGIDSGRHDDRSGYEKVRL